MAKFRVYRDKQGEYRRQFVADNGRTVADSAEGYAKRDDCTHGIDIVKREAAAAKVSD